MATGELNIKDMEVEEFQELAAAVFQRLGYEPLSVHQGIYELTDNADLEAVQITLSYFL